MVAGEISKLPLWEKRIRGDSTIRPTPTVKDGTAGPGESLKREGGLNLRTAVQKWPTPNARDWKGSPGAGSIARGGRKASLPAAVARETFPTPMSRDHKSGSVSEATLNKNSRPLSEYVKGQLNPDWVEWLMGFQEGWTK